MGFYSRYIFPRIMDMALSREDHTELRVKLLAEVEGEIMELGLGSGLNLPCYPSAVTKLAAIEPNPGMQPLAKSRTASSDITVMYHRLSGDTLPVEDSSFDCVVSTWTLCSIDNISRAIKEVHRTLKPGGKFFFLEHGLSDDPSVAASQRRWNPVTRRLLGGCNINRDIKSIVKSGGLQIATLDRYMLQSTFKIMGNMYQGVAVKPRE